MRLVIRANSLKSERLSQTIVGEFDERGGTIGRSDSNTMSLPDPERHVSRLQAEITYAGGVFSVRNVGSSNPIIVNGRPVGPGDSAGLRSGDRMTIGGYELQVSLENSASPSSGPTKPVDARTVIGASAGESRTHPPRQSTMPGVRAMSPMADPFADLIDTPAPIGAADPFADLLAPAPPPAGSPAPAGASRAPATARLPEDFDPFADTTSPPPHGTAAKDPSLGDLVGDRSASPGSLDILFDLSEASPSKRDALEEFLAPSAAADAPLPSDPFAFLSPDASSKRDNTGPAAADHTPALQAAYRPPPVRHPVPDVLIEPAPAAADVPAAPASPHPAPTPDAVLWTAFCEGARVRLPGQQHLTPELMRLIGATLRQAVEGTVQLSAARTTTKQELHVPVTTIQAKNNNPLKFAPDGASALAMLLQPPMRGFMAAPEAVQDAMADLLGHTVGTMAGTRAAIEGMLRRFEPAQLEKQLSSGGVLDTLVPMNRRAKLWELYLQHYDRISEGAREDFQELFGRAFIKAYEEQADRVAAAQRGRR